MLLRGVLPAGAVLLDHDEQLSHDVYWYVPAVKSVQPAYSFQYYLLWHSGYILIFTLEEARRISHQLRLPAGGRLNRTSTLNCQEQHSIIQLWLTAAGRWHLRLQDSYGGITAGLLFHWVDPRAW
jgi:hypothetical protein